MAPLARRVPVHGFKSAAARADYMHAHYLKNKDRYAAHQRSKRARNREFVRQSKDGQPCSRCGEVFPHFVMDYHHRDPEHKRATITSLRGGCSLETIAAEIAKCDLLCANCHRIVEYGEQPDRDSS